MRWHPCSLLLLTLPALPLVGSGCARSHANEAVPDGGMAGACKPLGESAASLYRVRYDQVGYSLDADRFAVVVSPGLSAPRYRIHDATT